MPPAMTNMRVGSNKVVEKVRNDATLEGLTIPLINRPHPNENPLTTSKTYGRTPARSFRRAASVQTARESKLAAATRFSKVKLVSNGRGDKLTRSTPKSDAVFMRVENAKPEIMNITAT